MIPNDSKMAGQVSAHWKWDGSSMKEKDVIFLCQFFYPEHNSSATLPWDTAKYFASNGFKIGVMCGYPKEYNTEGTVPAEEVVDNVHIKRLHYVQLKRSKRIGRLINYFSFTLSVLLHIRELKKCKCVVVYSNPPVLPVAAVLANKLYKTKIVFVSYDVYPEIAFASNSLSPGSFITKGMNWLNQTLFKKTSAVVALTEEMREFLLSHRSTLSADRITVIPNWAHEECCQRTPDAFQRFGYNPDNFIVSYFGNMGICQDVETMLDAISRLKENDHFKFFIVGHGGKKEYVKEKTKDKKNVQVLDFLTGKEFEQAASISSCSIVSLEHGLRGMCAPSKYYSYLQGGIPVIAVADKESYLAQEITQKQIGAAVEIGDGLALAKAIEDLAREKARCGDMAKRAKELYVQKYSRTLCLEMYAKLLRSVLENTK